MYKVIINPKKSDNYYNVTLASSDESHFINIYICMVDGNVSVTTSKSEDGSYFKNPCEEASDLQVISTNSIEEAFNAVKDYFIAKGYKFSIH